MRPPVVKSKTPSSAMESRAVSAPRPPARHGPLVVVVAYFAAVYLGRRTRPRLLAQYILRSAKRIYGVPEFHFYTVADGIKQLLFSSQRRIGPPLLQPGGQFLLLPFDA